MWCGSGTGVPSRKACNGRESAATAATTSAAVTATAAVAGAAAAAEAAATATTNAPSHGLGTKPRCAAACASVFCGTLKPAQQQDHPPAQNEVPENKSIGCRCKKTGSVYKNIKNLRPIVPVALVVPAGGKKYDYYNI